MDHLMIPRFKNGDLVPNEELDVYPQTQADRLGSLSLSDRMNELAETERLIAKQRPKG